MSKAKTVCSHTPCPVVVDSGRCPTHERQTDRARGTRQARGYDAEYDRVRKSWATRVAKGGVHCHAPTCLMPARLIAPGDSWDLGHDDQRRIRGPEHARCNRSAGGRAVHRT